MSSFALYMVGLVMVVGALCYGAHLLGIGPQWIVIGALVVLGVGVMGGVARTRRRDPSQAD